MFVKTTQEAKEKLQAKISALIAFENKIIAGDQNAIAGRMLAMQQDNFDYARDTSIRCSNCGDHEAWEFHPAYTAYADDFDGVIVGCIDCKTILRISKGGGNLAAEVI